MANQIDQIAPPALPVAANAYTQMYENQKINVFRLFFNRLTNLIGALLDRGPQGGGGKVLYFPTALFYSTETQTVAAVNTAQPITFNNTYINKGISVVNDTRITVASDGVFNFQLSCELDKKSGSGAIAYIWIRKNGTDQPYSTHTYHLSGSDAALEANWNFNYDMVAGDYIEMMFVADDDDVIISSIAPTSPHVGIPSAVMAVNFVSNY